MSKQLTSEEITEIINIELKDLITFIGRCKEDRMLGEGVQFNWLIIRSQIDFGTILEFNLEAYNPIRMKFMLSDITSESKLVTICTQYKELIFRYTIFGR